MYMQEDIVSKLIDFLVAPHATTTVLLAEKEKVFSPFFHHFVQVQHLRYDIFLNVASFKI